MLIVIRLDIIELEKILRIFLLNTTYDERQHYVYELNTTSAIVYVNMTTNTGTLYAFCNGTNTTSTSSPTCLSKQDIGTAEKFSFHDMMGMG